MIEAAREAGAGGGFWEKLPHSLKDTSRKRWTLLSLMFGCDAWNGSSYLAILREAGASRRAAWEGTRNLGLSVDVAVALNSPALGCCTLGLCAGDTSPLELGLLFLTAESA